MRKLLIPMLLSMSAAGLALVTPEAAAADPVPEIQRAVGTAQADGVVHTLRLIPEACARLEGTFTGQAAQPYAMSAVRTGERCQARARYVDAASAKPGVASGWKLNDVIRVPSAGCPTRQAVVRVWRKPLDQTVELDAQGKSRIYLADAKEKAAEARKVPVPMFSAVMTVEGKACG